MGLTGMAADDVTPGSQVRDGLELVVPQDDASCAEMIALNEAAYGMEMPGAAEHLGKHALWQNAAAVGKVNGQPVSCSAVLMQEGYRYVCFVASHPDHRRRGYADAAMRCSLEAAAEAHGRTPTFLHATDAGRPVYEKMGYKPVSTHSVFIESRFASGH
jgi:predicted GNAT family acetyltransferase